MRAVLQRVSRAEVTVGDEPVGRIGGGLVVLLGVGHGDTEADAEELATKVANLRIFEDPQGKTNRSLLDVAGQALVVSQFTLYADCGKGRRPSFTDAADPALATVLVDRFRAALASAGVPTAEGRFGATMSLELTNEGPFTIMLDTARTEEDRS